MADFIPLLIERTEGVYQVTQGADSLLRLPQAIFERFDADCVFPPLWTSPGGIHPVRRLYWSPEDQKFLMFGLDENVVRFGDAFGPAGFRSFLQAFWVPNPPLILSRPFWNPETPYDPFDAVARRRSFEIQRRFLALLDRLRPPDGYGAILNAIDPYLDALGLNPEGRPGDPDEILELSLTPATSLSEPNAAAALERLATEQAGDCFPVLRRGAFVGVHTLGLRERLAAEAELLKRGLECQDGPAYPH